MRSSTERKIQAGFAFALACLVAVALLSWVAVERWRANAAWVGHTYTVMAHLEELFSTVVEAQNGQRGYALTGDERFLEPYRRAVEVAPVQLGELRRLTADNAAQQQRLAIVAEQVEDLLGRSREIVEVRRTQGLEAAQRKVRLGEGRALHDEFRRLVDEINSNEETLLAEREAREDRSAKVTQSVIVGLGALALAFVGLALWAIRRDLAGRQRAEAELERFFSLSLDFLCIASSDGYFKRVSPAVTDVLGWSVEEFLARPFLDFVHPDDREVTLLEVDRQVIAGEKVLHFENRYQHKDGSWRMLSWRSMPQPDGLMYATARDVTELKRSEAALRESKDHLEARVRERTAQLLEAAEELRVEIDERTAAQHKLNAQLERLHLLQKITHAIGERQDIGSIFQVVVRTVEDRLPVDFACICLYEAAENRLTVSRVGVKSRALAMELALGEQSSVEIDGNGLARCVRGELVFEPDISQVRFPFPQRLAAGGLRALVAAPLLVESKVFGVFLAARRKAGSFSSGECEFLKQLSEHVALASQQAQLYGALQTAYEDLRRTQQAVMQQERLRALGEMASGIAHDINNAISPITLYTGSLLEREPGLSEQARRYLETIQRAIDDVAQTVTRMRDFYRPREPQMTLVPVDLNQVLQQVMDLTRARWSDMAQQRGLAIEVRKELDLELPAILGAENEIREALTNLIFNAVDAMPEGGTLTLRTRASGQQAHVEVVDTGVGMDEKTRQRCLEPFFTTKGDRGTGLGLATVYGVTQRHAAELDIESALDRGTTVRLSFAIPAAQTAEAPQTSTMDAARSGLRILLVDDDPILLRSLEDILSADGHVITVTHGGQEGINAFRAAQASSAPFDVVITDLGMPYVDGRQVAAALKKQAPSMPVILLTGWGQRMIDEGEIPPHVDRVLSKPPKIGVLREALAALTAGG